MRKRQQIVAAKIDAFTVAVRRVGKGLRSKTRRESAVRERCAPGGQLARQGGKGNVATVQHAIGQRGRRNSQVQRLRRGEGHGERGRASALKALGRAAGVGRAAADSQKLVEQQGRDAARLQRPDHPIQLQKLQVSAARNVILEELVNV